MKKFLVIVLAMVLCFSFTACSNDGSNEETESVEDKVKDAVEAKIMATIAVKYDTKGVPSITYYVDETSENEFEVTGKVTVKDKYGDSYTGKYDAVVKYDPKTDDCDADCTVGTLYKNK